MAYLPLMKRLIPHAFLIFLAMSLCFTVQGHDVVTTAITWDREISRIVYERCASCHREEGTAFSLMTYAQARPWAVAIKEEVLSRRMPPWGAIKGFGEFRNDQALTGEQLEMIQSWADGGVPEGNSKDLLPPPPKLPEPSPRVHRDGEIAAAGDFVLNHEFMLDGLLPQKTFSDESMQLTAEFPDGSVEPLLWLYEYKPTYTHAFLFRAPIRLPRGTAIRGIPSDASVILLPPDPDAVPEKPNDGER